MSPLVREHWRRTRVPYVALLVFAIFTHVLMANSGGQITLAPAGVTPWPAWFAASLAARLARPGSPGEEYWAALPVSRSRTWRSGLVFGALGVVLSVAILAITHQIAFSQLVVADSGWTPPFHADEVLALALLTFAATAYFAQSFENPMAARQAGLPGFCVALVFDSGWIGDDFVLRPWRAWTWTAAFVVVAFLCSASLALRRAPAPGPSIEGTLAAGAMRARLLHAIGQVAFVALPLVAALLAFARWLALELAAPFPPVVAGVCAVVALAALPRTVHIRRAAHDARERIAATFLGATGVGLAVWRALRPSTAATTCARCGTVRSARGLTCSSCGSAKRALVPMPWTTRKFALHLPWNLAVASLLGLFAAQYAWQWFQPVTGTWTVRATLPGVTFRVGADPMEHRELHGSTTRGWDSSGFQRHGGGLGGFRSAELPSSHAESWTIVELRTALVGDVEDANELAATRRRTELALPFDATLTASVAGRAIRMSDLRATGGSSNVRFASTTWIGVVDDFATARASRLVSALREREDPPPEFAQLGPDDEPLLTYFVRAVTQELAASADPRRRDETTARAELARRAVSFLDQRLAPGKWSDARRDLPRARRALSELAFRAPLAEIHDPWFARRPYDLSIVWAPLRTLTLCAPDELLHEEVLEGNIFAALAAGMRADTDLFEPCERLFRAEIRDASSLSFGGTKSFALVWVMLAIDRRSAGDVLVDEGLPDLSVPAVREGLKREADEAKRLRRSATFTITSERARREFSLRLASLEPDASAEQFWLGW